jgi:hypothetical protein
VCGLLDVHDKVKWGILPDGCFRELYGACTAQIVVAVSGKFDYFARYRDAFVDMITASDNRTLLECIYRAIAAGFTDKWGE